MRVEKRTGAVRGDECGIGKLNQTRAAVHSEDASLLLCAGFAGSMKLSVARTYSRATRRRSRAPRTAGLYGKAPAKAKGMKVAQLQEDELGQPTEGTKPELIEQLVSARRRGRPAAWRRARAAPRAPLLNKLDESTTHSSIGPAVRRATPPAVYKGGRRDCGRRHRQGFRSGRGRGRRAGQGALDDRVRKAAAQAPSGVLLPSRYAPLVSARGAAAAA